MEINKEQLEKIIRESKEEVINDFEKAFEKDCRQGAWKLHYYKLGLIKNKHLGGNRPENRHDGRNN